MSFFTGCPRSSIGKESACSAGDLGSIPGSGRSPGERNGNPLQYSCLENPMDRGVWQATAHGVARVGHDLATKPPPPPFTFLCSVMGFLDGSEVNNQPANARDVGLIPGLGKSPEEEKGSPISIVAWEILWTEQPGGLRYIGSQGVRLDLATKQQCSVI